MKKIKNLTAAEILKQIKLTVICGEKITETNVRDGFSTWMEQFDASNPYEAFTPESRKYFQSKLFVAFAAGMLPAEVTETRTNEVGPDGCWVFTVETAGQLDPYEETEETETEETTAPAEEQTTETEEEEEKTMKNYQIKPEYYDLWGAYEGNDIVTAEEITELAREWEMTVAELMEQVDEQTTETETVTETEEMKEDTTVEKIKVVYEKKEGRTYTETWRSEKPEEVYERLAHCLIAKKLNNCGWIHSIKRVPLYNGFDRITVTHDNGGRDVYTVASH